MSPSIQLTFCAILLIDTKTSANFFWSSSELEMTLQDEGFFEKVSNPVVAIISNQRPSLRSLDVRNFAVVPKSTMARSELAMKAIESDTDASDATSEESESAHFSGLKLTSQQKNMLRKKWRASCDKKAAKYCRKACDTARKNTCRSYRCRKSLTKSFKRECKRSCKINFVGKDSKSDSE